MDACRKGCWVDYVCLDGARSCWCVAHDRRSKRGWSRCFVFLVLRIAVELHVLVKERSRSDNWCSVSIYRRMEETVLAA